MVGRPTKFTPEKGQQVIDRLRAGGTRKAAAESVGVDNSTLLRWLAWGETRGSGPFREFRQAVARAESEAEILHTATLQKAATGWDASEVHRTSKTVVRIKKTRLPDGTVVEEPIAFEETSETVVTRREFDWRASLEWLKRRRRDDWTERVDQDVTLHAGDLDTAIAAELARLAGGGQAPTPGAAEGAEPGD